MSTHEAPRTDLYPPYINDLYLSKYVVSCFENTPMELKPLIEINCRNFYNWTWGFRAESDILESYGYYLVDKKSEPPKKWSSRITNLNSKIDM